MIMETERLILRPLEERDHEPLVALNADPEVMRFFPWTRTAAETSAQFDAMSAHYVEHGFGFMAAELKADASFVGLLGINRFNAEMIDLLHGHPEVEIGWRFHKRFWGQGLAPEGARAWLGFAWDRLDLDEIVAITFRDNLPSQRVMEKIGMHRDPDGDFEHPVPPPGHPIRPHVLYRMDRPADRPT